MLANRIENTPTLIPQPSAGLYSLATIVDKLLDIPDFKFCHQEQTDVLDEFSYAKTCWHRRASIVHTSIGDKDICIALATIDDRKKYHLGYRKVKGEYFSIIPQLGWVTTFRLWRKFRGIIKNKHRNAIARQEFLVRERKRLAIETFMSDVGGHLW